jgi:hypothetical protein
MTRLHAMAWQDKLKSMPWQGKDVCKIFHAMARQAFLEIFLMFASFCGVIMWRSC